MVARIEMGKVHAAKSNHPSNQAFLELPFARIRALDLGGDTYTDTGLRRCLEPIWRPISFNIFPGPGYVLTYATALLHPFLIPSDRLLGCSLRSECTQFRESTLRRLFGSPWP